MFFVLMLAFALPLALTDANTGRASCCIKKTVGNVHYTLRGHEDTSSYGCLNDCVYGSDNEQDSKVCFRPGDQPPTCEGHPVTCLTRPQERLQEIVESNGSVKHACCDDRQIKTCTGVECADIGCGLDGGCIILTGNTTDATDVENICQLTEPHNNNAILITDYDCIQKCTSNKNGVTICTCTSNHPSPSPCFAPNTKALMKSGEEKLMKDLKIGEEVMSDDQGGVTEFVGWLEKRSDDEVDYLQITTTGGDQLTLTGSHIVFYFRGNISTSTFARNLVPGDVLVGKHGEDKVIHNIETVTMTGSLSPLTRSGTILANNIYSSCYASFPHKLANLAMMPARLFPGLFLDNKDTVNQDGIRTYVATMKWIGRALGFGRKDEKNERDEGVIKAGEIPFAEESMVPYGQFCQLIHK